MKKTINKIKTFAQKHEEELIRHTYYAVGVVAGITAAHIYNKSSFDSFAKRNPDLELILKDKKGYFHGFNRINTEEEN